jgi:hypothetical protein
VIQVPSKDPAVAQSLQDPNAPDLMMQFWSDGQVRVSGRDYNGLIESPCYKNAKEDKQRLSCFSCHQMHPKATTPEALATWADDQLGPGMRTNQACTQCHKQYEDKAALAAHTHHAAGSSGSSCYNCHMPYTTYGLLKAIRSHTITSPSVQESLTTGRPNACNQCHLDKTLAWSAEKLDQWYKIKPPDLDDDQKTVAASILWSLKGDAGQRALMAWSFGWPEARDTSGSAWMTPYLTELINDKYETVRMIALRSLRKQPGFADIDYDPYGPLTNRLDVIQRIKQNHYMPQPGERIGVTGPQLLLNPDGTLERKKFFQLQDQQDGRDVHLVE